MSPSFISCEIERGLRTKQAHVREQFPSGHWLKILVNVKLSRLRATPGSDLADRCVLPPDLAHREHRVRHANCLRNAVSRESVSCYTVQGDRPELRPVPFLSVL